MSVSNKWARIEELCVLKNAFSLMEMMVVLLIVAILAAATAPMVTKKMARNAGSGESPWVYTGLRNSIAFNMNGNDNSPVIIGASSLPASLESPTRLFIDSGDNASHIAFGNGNATPIGITADPTNGRIGISNQQVPNTSVAFGTGQTINSDRNGLIAIGANTIAGDDGTDGRRQANNVIAIGNGAQAMDPDSISIGNQAQANKSQRHEESLHRMLYGGNIAIGALAKAQDYRTIAIGYNAITSDSSTSESSDFAIAIGNGAQARGNNSIAIGNGAIVAYGHENSVAIGAGATTDNRNQIVLGTAGDTVHIRGNLIVDGWTDVLGNLLVQGDSILSTRVGSRVYMRVPSADNATDNFHRIVRVNNGSTLIRESAQNISTENWHSDRRLKNVGEKYTAGLDELKKLDFFHYTYKKNEDKTPHVGVMAQDLQKVFPDAVTEGDDGYLRIRLEDMFYAVINAVKELDKKITQIVENVTSLSKKVDEQEKIIAEQQKLIEELQAQNANIEKRLAKVEKKSKKVEE